MSNYEPRKFVVQAIFIFMALVFIGRLFYLQVIDDSLKTKASDVGKRIIFPARGLIYDRTGKLIVGNKPIYELLVVQAQVVEMDTAKFCELLGINDSIFKAHLEKLSANRRLYSRHKPEPFLDKIDAETFTRFEEHLHEFPGFYTQVKNVRTYPFPNAAHVLGDIGEVSPAERERSKNYYELGEFIGKSGIEQYYEDSLRGEKGIQYYLKDNIGRDLGSFDNGAYDSVAHSGKNLMTSIDIELQQFGEELMQNKRGSIVAIEPTTGEILAFISSPGYDPNLLVGRERGMQFTALNQDTVNKPLINRPLTAIYPPGSIFKPIMGLIGVQEGAINFNTGYTCYGGYHLGSLTVGCHHHVPIHSLNKGIQYSCNAYFCNVFKRFLELPKFENEGIALDKWAEYLHQFNLGYETGIDLYSEIGGSIPTAAYYDQQYNNWRWRASTVISLAIGQGEMILTPLQMANMYTILANNGFYYTPHLARYFESDGKEEVLDYKKKQVDIDKVNFEYIRTGLENVVLAGTARMAYVDSISICGKTGTAQNPHGEDHSIFAAFAPRENPQIAIAVVVENSGFGGTWAAPIASLMIEYYLNRKISKKRKWHLDRILNAKFIHLP
jgi:penicillin-binding protein 2